MGAKGKVDKERYQQMKDFVDYIRDKGMWPSFSPDIEMNWVRFDGIKDICEIKVDKSMCNPNQTIHGGAMATLIDNTSSWSAIHRSGYGPDAKGRNIERGWNTTGVSQNLNVTYLGATAIGEIVSFETTVLQQGKNVSVTRTDVIEKSSGRLLAFGIHTKVDNVPKPQL